MTTTTMEIPISVNRIITRMLRRSLGMIHTHAATVRKEANAQAGMQQLHNLPTYLLRDMGIARDEIEDKVERASAIGGS